MYVVIEMDHEYGGCCGRDYVYRVFGPFTEANADAFVDKQERKSDFQVEKLEEES